MHEARMHHALVEAANTAFSFPRRVGGFERAPVDPAGSFAALPGGGVPRELGRIPDVRSQTGVIYIKALYDRYVIPIQGASAPKAGYEPLLKRKRLSAPLAGMTA